MKPMKIIAPVCWSLMFLCSMGGVLIAPLAAKAQTAGTRGTSMPDLSGMSMGDRKPTPPTTTPSSSPATKRFPPSATPATDDMKPMPSMGTPSNLPAPQRALPMAPGKGMTTLPNQSPDKSGWPSPVADEEKHTFLLFDLLEIQRTGGEPYAGRWDIVGWSGGDYQRIWFKTEGRQNLSSAGGEADVQLLYGKLISSFFDFQAGLRYDRRYVGERTRSRFLAAVGLQGLAPYRFDIEPTLFVSQDGQISARFTGVYDILLSQRLILQPRLEANAALQSREEFGIGSGLNDVELGLRLRYEIRRQFAPYIGVTYGRSFGGTSSLLRTEGEATRRFSIVAGLRLWF